MVCVVLDLRKNNWIPRHEEVKSKTIGKIHIEAENNLGLHPGATASMRNSHDIDGLGGLSAINRPGTGGMMLGCL
ncbi:hypothetical protein B296_00001807 [Ensete ventricosum]|uniref:Uncharacterized protein n=1 Tax=Ensete ventricosum TaxID=4639 RepID=A0A427AQJ5_ENSVE|nr:hypothetical protein B296_00001807 [Ensete ventricosum]